MRNAASEEDIWKTYLIGERRENWISKKHSSLREVLSIRHHSGMSPEEWNSKLRFFKVKIRRDSNSADMPLVSIRLRTDSSSCAMIFLDCSMTSAPTASRCITLGPAARRDGRSAKFWQNVARFRLSRLRFLQENMRFAAFFKIYQILKLTFLKFEKILQILRHLQFFCWICTKIAVYSSLIFAKILRLQRCKRMQIL